MANLIYDAALCFGKISAAGNFPNAIALGKQPGSTDHYPGKDFTNVDRMTVDVLFEGANGGADVTVNVLGSMDGVAGSSPIGQGTFTLADRNKGACQVAVTSGKFPYVMLNISGGFTGKATAYLNTYAGK